MVGWAVAVVTRLVVVVGGLAVVDAIQKEKSITEIFVK